MTERHANSQFSLRSLVLLIAIFGFLLVPVAWVAHERRRMLNAQEALLQAREIAIRSVVLEERRRLEAMARSQLPDQRVSTSSATALLPTIPEPNALDRLHRENTALRREVETLRRQLAALQNLHQPPRDSEPSP